MLHLFTVTDVFYLEEFGCVLVPGLPTEPGSPNIGRGAKIRLKTPQGEEIDTFIKGIEMITYRPNQRQKMTGAPIVLPKNINKEQVPVGTEIFLLDPP